MTDDAHLLEDELRQLEVQALNFAARFARDGQARQNYIRTTRTFVAELRAARDAGEITNRQAAEAAQQMRNEVMEQMRRASSDVGEAWARRRKRVGRTLNELLSRYSRELFGRRFDDLTPAQRERVRAEILEAAARPDPRATRLAGRLRHAARALWVVTAVCVVVNVATAENRAHAVGREGTNLAGGFAGAVAGGAITGASFGMALGPIGVAAGVIIGGALGAILADEVYLEAAGVGNREVDAIIDPYTSIMRVDSSGLAAAILRECGINMDRALTVFAALRRDYSMNLDNVAAHYVEGVRRAGGSVLHALRLHRGMRELLAEAMEGGWRTRREGELAAWVKAL